jgi:hypothetical protein
MGIRAAGAVVRLPDLDAARDDSSLPVLDGAERGKTQAHAGNDVTQRESLLARYDTKQAVG